MFVCFSSYFGRCVQPSHGSQSPVSRFGECVHSARAPRFRHIHRVGLSDSIALHKFQCTPWLLGGFNEKDVAVKKTAARTYMITKGKKKIAGGGTAAARRIIPLGAGRTSIIATTSCAYPTPAWT